MYNLILIDDEPHVLEGLRMINWRKYGFTVVRSFCEVEEALAFMCNETVHLVIADVRMPVLSGLMLTENMRKLGLSAEVILMSGYQDFNDVKQAMKLNVYEYIVKPVFEEDIVEVLQAVHAQIYAREQWKQKIHLSPEEHLKLYLAEGVTTNHSFFTELDESLHKGAWYFMEIVTLYKLETAELTAILDVINKQLKIHQVMVIENQLTETCFLIELSKDECGLSVLEEHLLNLLIQQGIEGHFYATDRLTSIHQLKAHYDSIHFIDLHLTRRSQTKWMWASESYKSTDKDFDFQAYLVDIIKHIDRGLVNELSQVIIRLFDALEQERVSLHHAKEIIISIYQSSYSKIKKHSVEIDQPIDDNEMPSFDDLPNMEACYLFIDGQTRKHLELSAFLQKKQRQPCLHQIEVYVDTHLAEPITIKQLASEFYMHPNYLGHKMKEEWGESFIHYLNKKRIERAIYLIDTTMSAIEEIAEKVGYNNYNQFLKWFKRITHDLPTDYRNRSN